MPYGELVKNFKFCSDAEIPERCLDYSISDLNLAPIRIDGIDCTAFGAPSAIASL